MIIKKEEVAESNFIVLEGINGSGKSSVCKLLSDFYGSRVYFTREPGGTQFGAKIREIILNPSVSVSPFTELFLIQADRSEHIQFLKQVKKPIISDRYFYSTIAFQGAGRELGVEFVSELCDRLVAGFKPGVVILFDCSVELGLSRKESKDRIELCDINFHRRVREEYLRLAEVREEPFIILDSGSKNIDELFYECKDIIQRAFKFYE